MKMLEKGLLRHFRRLLNENDYRMKFIGLYMMTILMSGMSAEAANPFFSSYKTPHQTFPFDKVKIEHFMQQSIDRAGGVLGNKGDEAAITAIRMIALNKENFR